MAHAMALSPGLKTRDTKDLELGWSEVSEEDSEESPDITTVAFALPTESVTCGFRYSHHARANLMVMLKLMVPGATVYC